MMYVVPSTIDRDFIKKLNKAELRYINDSSPGISRKRNGKGFKYFEPDGTVVGSFNTVERIKALAIPPAWEEVWICPSRNGYLQATGIDAKGRKQYIYHSDWVELCQQNKFDKVPFFGKVLPEIRQKVRSDMNQNSLSKEQILATVVWLLEHTFIRVGNDEYAKENNSFGLTTLRNRHVLVRGENIKFEFRGKSGIDHSVTISDPKVAKIIKECIELPGYEIFKYVDEENNHHPIDSAEVNDYLKAITGEDITAKDFRTWGATVLSADTLHKLGDFKTKEIALENIKEAVKIASTQLGNTPLVCRNYYIHPTIIDTYQKKVLVPHFEKVLSSDHKKAHLSRPEQAVLTLLTNYS